MFFRKTWLLIALFALFAVAAVGTFYVVEVVDSDTEIAAFIDVADFSIDAVTVSVEQVAVTDTLTTSVYADQVSTSKVTDHPLSTTDFGVDVPDIRLAVTIESAVSPELSAFGDGGIL